MGGDLPEEVSVQVTFADFTDKVFLFTLAPGANGIEHAIDIVKTGNDYVVSSPHEMP